MGNIPKAEVKAALCHVLGQNMGAAMHFGAFLGLDMDYKVLKVLGIDVDGLTATTINNMLESDWQKK